MSDFVIPSWLLPDTFCTGVCYQRDKWAVVIADTNSYISPHYIPAHFCKTNLLKAKRLYAEYRGAKHKTHSIPLSLSKAGERYARYFSNIPGRVTFSTSVSFTTLVLADYCIGCNLFVPEDISLICRMVNNG